MLSLLLGVLIVVSVVLSGGRGAALLWHGGLVALALLAAASDAAAPLLPCLAAVCVLAVVLPLAWGLARLEDDPPTARERAVGVGAGLMLTVLAVVAVPRGLVDMATRPGLIAALTVILCGVLAAAVRRSVVGQCAGLAAAVNGLMLLAGLSGRGGMLAGVVVLQAALMLVAFVCLRRIAWRSME
ncbi:conserved hypothetical protein [Gluconacetobacter diazotrophicus PA1 5]|uniref:hypothetical protein n=1 Tax=Gluconacetobacter diazotrophicus TaxID=33996 RepID=UPI000173B380|nr:hypothetical protein [Gluconacetobacter diazotrophicus]ACI52787.1 conserved hypothetical protein [Gluconacetobacter diazotrophicus PA1 5]TWB09068.1 hydrogenase-4 component E [Gluconacetobacter diazotrophicus]